MISREFIGRVYPPGTIHVEEGRLRLFAKAIGETNPIYTDEAAAKAAGHRSLLAPPTFTFCLETEVYDPVQWLREMNVDIGRILHGEQSFTYHAPVCVGDTLTFEARISDIYHKKSGALEFIVKDTKVKNQEGKLVAEQRAVIVVSNQRDGRP